MALLNDNISETLSGVQELVRDLPPEAKGRAKFAAVALEHTFQALRSAHPRDPAVALGAAFAIFTIADRLVHIEADSESKGAGLIQLIG
ncbi:MAG: hypothetical protein ACHP7H_01445 [Hyphomicrobiales bacterium]